jgi:hypothetical protein
MKRLGYTRFVAQGGDWGAIITDVMAVQAPPELIGMHTNMAGVVPADVSTALAQSVLGAGGPAPSDLSAEDSRTYEQLNFFYTNGIGYGIEMITQPQALYGIADSLVHNVDIPAAVSVFPKEIYKAPRSWPSGPTPSSSTSTSSTAAATSPPGGSRRCSPASCAPRSDPCASGPNGRLRISQDKPGN